MPSRPSPKNKKDSGYQLAINPQFANQTIKLSLSKGKEEVKPEVKVKTKEVTPTKTFELPENLAVV